MDLNMNLRSNDHMPLKCFAVFREKRLSSQDYYKFRQRIGGNERRLLDMQCVLNDTSKAFDYNIKLNRDYIPSKYSPRFEILYIISVTESVSKYVMVRSLTHRGSSSGLTKYKYFF